MQTIIYGSDNEGIRLTFETTPDNKFIAITGVTLLCFGKEQPITNLVESMQIEFRDYIIKELNIQDQYRRLEKAFYDRLGDIVKIENRIIYEECLKEFASRTEDDNRMHDLNGSVRGIGINETII